jgi:Family of unknown function (DUF6504)
MAKIICILVRVNIYSNRDGRAASEASGKHFMSRLYGEPVNVQARDDGRPVRFVWRGRLYTVRAILEHWIVNREWWQDPDPLGPLGSSSSEGPGPDRPGPGPDRPGPEPDRPGPDRPESAQPELEFWRVEASPGHGMTAGIYELRRDVAADAWTLRPGAP